MAVSQCHTSHVRTLAQHLHTQDSSQKDRWTTSQLDTHKNFAFRSKQSTCTDSLSLNTWSLEDFTNHSQSTYSHPLATSTLEQSQLYDSLADDVLSASWSSDTLRSQASTELDDQEHNRWLADFCSQSSSSPSTVSQQRTTSVPAYLVQHSHPAICPYYPPNLSPISTTTDTRQTVTPQEKMETWDIAFDWYENNKHKHSDTTLDTTHSNSTQVYLNKCSLGMDFFATVENEINDSGEVLYQDVGLEGEQHSDGAQSSNHDVQLDKTKIEVMDAADWNKIGMELQETEQDVEAIDAFRRAVDLDMKMLDAWLNLAISYANEHQRGNVYDCLEAWLQHNDKYQHISGKDNNKTTIMTDRNTALVERFILAARCSPGVTLDKSSSLDSDATYTPAINEIDADVQVILGLLFYLADETQKSTDCFQAALACRPHDHRIWNQLGSVMLSQQDLQNLETSHYCAMDMYRSALYLNPEYTRARYNLAVAHMKLSQYDQAAHHLVTALTLQQKQQQRQRSVILPSPSSPMWSSLRLVMYMLNFDHLAAACNSYDLTAFVAFLDDSCTFTPQ